MITTARELNSFVPVYTAGAELHGPMYITGAGLFLGPQFDSDSFSAFRGVLLYWLTV